MPHEDEPEAELPTMASAEVVEVVGRYPVVRFIGQGSSCRVFECKDVVSPPPDRGRHVAVKVLRPALVHDDDAKQRLRREGELLRSIPSPYVARCLDVGEHDGLTFLVQELLSGEDLRVRLERDGPLPLKDALRFARDAAKGLRAAWAAGVLHGDIKPANLFIDGRRLKIVDFGLALPVASLTTTASARPALQGTPAFLAPEVIRGGRPDARSDLYSLGCTLFALLTGRPPFTATKTADLLVAHVQQTAPALQRVLPGVPPRVGALVERLLARDPARRPATHDECVALIEGALDEVVAVPSVPSVPAVPAAPTPAAPAFDPFAVDDAGPDGPAVGAPTGVLGSLKQMNVVEIVQSLEPGRKTATIDVQPTLGDKGVFAVVNGRVAYARTGSLVGEEAFYALVKHRAGMFRIHYGDAPREQNITAATQFLVLEALRRFDEGALDDGAATDAHATATSDTIRNGSHTDADPFAAQKTIAGVSPFASTMVRTAVASTPSAAGGPVSEFGLDAPTVALHPVTSDEIAPLSLPDGEPVDAPDARPPSTPGRGSGGAAPAKTRSPAPSPSTSPSTSTATPMSSASGARSGREAVAWALAGVRLGATKVAATWTRQIDAAAAAARARFGPHPAIARAQPVLRRPAALVALAALVVLLLVAVGRRGPGSVERADALARIDDGEAAAVLADLDALPALARTPLHQLLRGHALAALAAPAPPPDDALVAWREAARGGDVDDRALGGVLVRLRGPLGDDDGKDIDLVLDVLATWPAPTVIPRVRGLLADADWNVRQRARRALQERGDFADADADALGVLDLTTADTCPRRREGLLLLGERGSSSQAVLAIEAARGRRDDNACLLRELPAAARAVARRADNR